jgi:hypothetical protein
MNNDALSVRSGAPHGEVAEWLKATVSKTVIPETVSRVRISPSPNFITKRPAIWRAFLLYVDLSGIEPLTSSLRTTRSPN